jgi:exopolyphosphatase/guanosine-5'-triphosphate,3'-diphosphate pyrophosphatase
MESAAVIDIGTNSVKWLLVRRDHDNIWRILTEAIQHCRLGQGVTAEGRLQVAAMARTVAAIEDIWQVIQAARAETIIVIGTMALRQAVNAAEFTRLVQDRTGLTVEILSGDEEARLSCLGITSGLALPGQALVLFDSGGGSSEVIQLESQRMLQRVSLSLGAVSLTEQYLCSDPVRPAELAAASAVVAAQLASISRQINAAAMIGTGGTITTLAAMAAELASYDAERIHGGQLARNDLEAMIQRLAGESVAQRQNWPGLPYQRADIILAGALIVAGLLRHFNVAACTVSCRGLRYGVLRKLGIVLA